MIKPCLISTDFSFRHVVVLVYMFVLRITDHISFHACNTCPAYAPEDLSLNFIRISNQARENCVDLRKVLFLDVGVEKNVCVGFSGITYRRSEFVVVSPSRYQRIIHTDVTLLSPVFPKFIQDNAATRILNFIVHVHKNSLMGCCGT